VVVSAHPARLSLQLHVNDNVSTLHGVFLVLFLQVDVHVGLLRGALVAKGALLGL